MSSISSKFLRKCIRKIDLSKVHKKVAYTPFGHRAWPAETPKHDKRYNIRVDVGHTLENGDVEVIIQANKNAEDKVVRESAAEDSHKILAKVAINPKAEPDLDSFEEDAMDWFKKNHKQK